MLRPVNPFSQMLVSFTPERFFGRQEFIQPILQGVSSARPQSFCIQGIKTIGKTTLLHYLAHPQGAASQYDSFLVDFGPGRDEALVFLQLDFYKIEGPDMRRVFYEQLAASQDEIGAKNAKALPPYDPNEHVSELLTKYFQTLANEKIRLVICLDHFDSAFQSMRVEDDLFLRRLTDLHAFILVTEKGLEELRSDSKSYISLLTPVLFPMRLGLMPESEARELITGPLAGSALAFSKEECDFILQTAGRQPYLLTLVCDFVFNLRQQYPEEPNLLARPKAREQAMHQLSALPAVTALFTMLWSRLDGSAQAILLEVANSSRAALQRAPETLGLLTEKALLQYNFLTGQYALFSELFRQFVLRQSPAALPDHFNLEALAAGLSPLDQRILRYLAARPNQVCTFKELLQEFWKDPNASKRGLEACVHRIRARVTELYGEAWEYIRNIRGIGFQFVPKTE